MVPILLLRRRVTLSRLGNENMDTEDNGEYVVIYVGIVIVFAVGVLVGYLI